jgi:hypothetical protein
MTRQPTGYMEPTPGRHTTRRIEQPDRGGIMKVYTALHRPSTLALLLVECHNKAVRAYGSDCGGFHTFDPQQCQSAGVWDGTDGFPDGSVVTPLAWGLIDEALAQRVLEADGVDTEIS